MKLHHSNKLPFDVVLQMETVDIKQSCTWDF